MQTSEQTISEQLTTEITQFFGFFPPFFAPAQKTPQVLENLLQQTLSAYVNNPLPTLFKEKLFAYLSRYCSVPYCIVCHSCTLRALGMTARAVFTLLDAPAPTDEELNEQITLLSALTEPLPDWPEPGSALENSLTLATISLFLHPDRAKGWRNILEHLLGQVDYNHLVAFLSYVKTCHFWMETHPDIIYETDKRVQDHLSSLIADLPELANFFRTYQDKIRYEREMREKDATRKRTEKKLEESEEALRQAIREAATHASQLEAIFEAITDGVIVYDNRGNILRMNSAYRRAIGLDSRPEHALLAPDERGDALELRGEDGQPMPNEQRPVQRMLNGEVMTGKNTVDILVHTLDGHEVQLNVSGTPMWNKRGQLVGGVMIFRDVTERRKHEMVLREANARMDEFMGIASHELKTPLTTIKGYVQLVTRRLRNSSRRENLNTDEHRQLLVESAEVLERTDRQIARLTRLVNELLDASRIQANKLELHMDTHDLATIVQQTIEDQHQETPQRIINVDMPAEQIILIIADADRIGQVVSNYLSNALKYSPSDRPVEVCLQVEGQTACVSVRDEGLGLPFEEQERIWERFYRVEGIPVQSGTGVGLGLGLHICKKIIEQHSGQVGIESIPGQGSTFWFTLPLV